ncbi:MAG: S9 family peptidase, partial [Ignavibacteria bacterium]|nr:S9 family peptidase [Ignavibacteria bacterium]
MFKYFVLSLLLITAVFPQQKRALTFEDLWAMKRITSFDLDQQSNRLVFAVTSYDFEKNKGNSDIFIMDADGGNFKQLTDSEKNETQPEFTGLENLVSFIRDGQIFTINPETGIENQLTGFYPGINEYEWSRDGKKILFTSSVFPDCIDQDCNKRKDDSLANSKVKAQIFNKLMFRHWNEWRGDKRSHLFLYDTESKTANDIYPYIQNDIPPLALGSSNDFSFSPAGDEIAFTSNPDVNEAASTNNEVFTIKANNSFNKPVILSE